MISKQMLGHRCKLGALTCPCIISCRHNQRSTSKRWTDTPPCRLKSLVSHATLLCRPRDPADHHHHHPKPSAY